MELNPPSKGLRPLFNDSKQPAKVYLTIPAGDHLHVSDDVAEQLTGDPHFRDPAAEPAPKGAPAPADPDPAADELEATELEATEPEATEPEPDEAKSKSRKPKGA